MFPRKNISEAAGVSVQVSDKMASAIEKWVTMYQDEPAWKSSTVQTMNLPASIATEFARLVTMEAKASISGSERADWLQKAFVPVIGHLREKVETACALGGLAMRPYVVGDSVCVDFAGADAFFPVRYDTNGNVTACIFADRREEERYFYTRLEYHDFVDGHENVTNTAYRSSTRYSLGTAVPLSAVSDWAELLPEVVFDGCHSPLFCVFKMPFANNIDSDSKLGVSCFSRATELIEQADRQYSRLLWEFEGGELAVHVDQSALKPETRNGKEKLCLPKGKERLFSLMYGAMGGENGETFYKPYAPTLRDESYLNGLENLLRRIEFACCLSYGTLSTPQEVDKTAEEIKMSKQRSYSAVKDMQNALGTALSTLVDAMEYLADFTTAAIPAGRVDAVFTFDDSLINDKEKQMQEMRLDAIEGMIRPELYLAQKYGVTEEDALAMMPKSALAFGALQTL